MRTTTLEMAHAEKAGDLLRILMLENCPNDAELILTELREAGLAFEHILTENQQQFIRAISSEEFDAILSDYRLPSWTGLDALKIVRQAGKDVPFLLLTGTLGEEAAVECIKQGVSDYVLKEHLARLPQALERAIREKKLRVEHQRSRAALAESEARARAQFTELDLLYRTAPICLAVLDRNLRYLRVNESMAQNHGIPPAAHIGRTLREIVPENAGEAERFYREVFETGKPLLNVECKVKRTIAPFEERDYLATFSPLPGDDGTVSVACAIMVDITERKRAE